MSNLVLLFIDPVVFVVIVVKTFYFGVFCIFVISQIFVANMVVVIVHCCTIQHIVQSMYHKKSTCFVVFNVDIKSVVALQYVTFVFMP